MNATEIAHEWSDSNIRIPFRGLILQMLESRDH
jgi:hypothetical protein